MLIKLTVNILFEHTIYFSTHSVHSTKSSHNCLTPQLHISYQKQYMSVIMPFQPNQTVIVIRIHSSTYILVVTKLTRLIFFIPLHNTYNVSVHNVYSMCMLTYCITIRFQASTANLVLHPRVNFTYTAQVKPVLRHHLMMWYTVAESRRCSSLERMLWIFVKNVVTYCEKYGGLLATATHTYVHNTSIHTYI